MLRRIPAVKWAFNRLRPLPHSGSIDVAPIAADEPSAIIDIAESAPALDTNADPWHNDAHSAVTAPITENDAAIAVIAESPSAVPSDINVSDDSSRAAPTEGDPIAVEEPSGSSDVESEPIKGSDLVIGSDTSPELSAGVEPIVADGLSVSSADVESAPIDGPDVVIDADPSPTVLANVAPSVVDDSCVALVDAEASAADAPGVSTKSDPSSGIALGIELIPANDPHVAAIATIEPTSIDPAPAVMSLSPETSASMARAKVAEPIDRAGLIRRRWAETGSRMWNPRLHGTGDATLNIQGRVELLPPAAGETMPRYDKMEFKMLGGQIVCEGVIVEAPAQSSQRSFTRLAEPGNPERAREPVRERQAALA
ncbi:hypothetical protein FXV83_07435 [Bradyrhizobium hipponense]|uniref:Uncharacterized protein n=1 Tax=Bradyrhizobium hipponense TaxID=2605638 RepID=A0A5S4YSX6_9BRAD|nr:hypothetical protein [Bradyrhizobium hipponense]TYO67032.1 hypothetical protein FXV83_07435 [Bradyrhizobium hipponense]